MLTTEQQNKICPQINPDEKYSVKSIEMASSTKRVSYQQIQFYQNLDKDQIIGLKQQLKMKDDELEQKNQIIKQLQERCVMIGNYEQKISLLEEKSLKLQKLLDRMEKTKFCSYDQGEKENKYIEHQKKCENGFKQNIEFENGSQKKISCKSILKSQHKGNVHNRQLSKQLKFSNKQNEQPTQTQNNNKKIVFETPPSENPTKQKIKQLSNQINTFTQTFSQSTSSKFINSSSCPFTQQQKHKQIDQKFNKIKSNIQHKPNSSKNMQQIYSILNNHKYKTEGLAIKQINQKLQNILNQSVKLNTSRQASRDHKQDLSFFGYSSNNNNNKSEWKRQRLVIPKDTSYQRPRSQTYNFNTSFTTKNNKYTQPSNKQQKYQSNYNSTIFYRPAMMPTNDILQKMQNKKFNKILNATNVDDILRARKCFSTLNNSCSNSNSNSNNNSKGLNRSDIFGQKFDKNSKLFWK